MLVEEAAVTSAVAASRPRSPPRKGAGDDDQDTTDAHSPPVWTSDDWNAFFGFGTNILVNMLVLTGLLRFVVKMPGSLVFGRILPALGLMMCLSTFYYAWLAYRLALLTTGPTSARCLRASACRTCSSSPS